jgi:hypothetical protein
VDADTGFALVFLGSYAVAIGTIIYAYRKRRDKFVLVLVLCALLGAIGSLIAFLLISTPRSEPPIPGEAGVESCPHCGTAYRPSDYRGDAAIFCSDCRQQIRSALVPSAG